MYSRVIELADHALAANQRLRAEAADLRAEARAVILRYWRHRFQPISGASDASDNDGVRRLLRDFLSGTKTATSWVGPGRGSVCQACGSDIKPNEIEYDIVAEASELRLDAGCYRVFVQESDARQHSPDAVGD